MNRRAFVAGGTMLTQAAARGLEPPNEGIRKARSAALALLKPTESQLQRGFEPHQSSIVIEPYGFAPRAAPDGDAARSLYGSGISDREMDFLLDEMENTRFVPDPLERREFISAWKASGVTCVFQNAGQESQDPLKFLRLGHFTYALDMLRDFIVRVTDADDIPRAKQSGKVLMALSTNGAPLEQRWEAFWPTPIAQFPEGQESMTWTNWPLFTVGLVQRGYRDEDIQKIIGGNALRVLKAVFPPRPRLEEPAA